MHDWPERHASSPAELQARLAAERAEAPFLELRDGDGVQQIVALAGQLTVGRSPTAGLALPWDAQVSRSHTSIECLDGMWTVLDDGRSTNGTFVNEERVGGRRTLRHLDVIRVGATRLRFHDPSEAGQDSKLTEVAGNVAIPTLTPAQLRVLGALCRPADGPASNEEIADELTVSIDTVKTHMRALFDAFDLGASAPYRKRFELVKKAVDAGLVSPPR
ncbi:FHA domain-containing protein [Solirubrobacter phytolaccae]|uniref:FHA domain-containing protein n=1 Tax=Solirubrobacter phytolaccae TaxID=1404360 RepID=A0A9X3NQ74_9ACTN|nr:FHA domain-containing protein [Solirubrobacter phytolaccae]MDA0185532.1 FHA domain-containing protein [Solirubrobacter phytolaccae]